MAKENWRDSFFDRERGYNREGGGKKEEEERGGRERDIRSRRK